MKPWSSRQYILAIFSNANSLKNIENKDIPHQRYRLSVIDFDLKSRLGTSVVFPFDNQISRLI